MGLNNKQYDIKSLAEINENGFVAALFPQIRDALAKELKNIYGEDIELSSASNDGQYVMSIALILNNIYRVLENAYSNLNPLTAQGKYLDIIASLSNVRRKQATRSTCWVYVRNTNSSDVTPTSIELVDRNGDHWVWWNPVDFRGNKTITLNANTTSSLLFTCSTQMGAVLVNGTAVALEDAINDTEAEDGYTKEETFWNNLDTINNGDIYQTLLVNGLKVYQVEDSILGNNEESDESLRNRRFSSYGSGSLTVTESLKANLFSIQGVQDVYLINNVYQDNFNAYDNSIIPLHNVYIAIRLEKGYIISNSESKQYSVVPPSTISTAILSSLTPGVLTDFDATNMLYGEKMSQDFKIIDDATTNVYWKLCSPCKPQIIIKYYYTTAITGTGLPESQQKIIKSTLLSYLNNVGIDELVQSTTISTLFLSADEKPGGNISYTPYSCTIDGGPFYQSPITYFEYSEDDFVFEDFTSNGTGIIKIG